MYAFLPLGATRGSIGPRSLFLPERLSGGRSGRTEWTVEEIRNFLSATRRSLLLRYAQLAPAPRATADLGRFGTAASRMRG